MSPVREELIGLTTVAVLSLIGFALYSTTYSLVYASSSAKPVVAVLEMWGVSLQLISSIICVVIHFSAMSIFEMQSMVSSVLTSICLGIAILSTVVCNSCLTSGQEKICLSYFGAAAFPKFAAVGFCIWCWVIYMSSLSGQAWNIGVSLGFSKLGCLLATSILIMAPHLIGYKMSSTCQRNWLCESSCDDISIIIVIILSFLFMTIGEFTENYYIHTIIKRKNEDRKAREKTGKLILIFIFVMRILGSLIMIMGISALMISRPSHQQGIHIIGICLSCIPLISTLIVSNKKIFDVNKNERGYELINTEQNPNVTTAVNFQNFIKNRT